MSDMATRWAAAKLGPASVRDGKRMCVVHVECDGDPRAEVLEALEHAPEADAVPKARKRAKKGGGE